MDRAVLGLPDRVLAGGRLIGEHHAYDRVFWNVGWQLWKRRLLLCVEVADQTKEGDHILSDSGHADTSKNPSSGGHRGKVGLPRSESINKQRKL